MKHRKGFRTLNRTHSHRRALYKNMVEALFKNERITTTVTKAKELRRVAEKIITKAKVKNLHNIRQIGKLIEVNSLVKDKVILRKLFDDIAPRYESRNGGYTRIIKLASRKGDGADLCIIELVEDTPKSKKKKSSKKSPVALKKEAVVEEGKDVEKTKEPMENVQSKEKPTE